MSERTVISTLVPTIVWAKPRPEEVWRAYIAQKIKVRELNSGQIQIATNDEDWRDA